MNKTSLNSLPSKVNQLKEGEELVFFPKNWRNFMKSIETLMLRNTIPKVTYTKALVVVKETLKIGVLITKQEEQEQGEE